MTTPGPQRRRAPGFTLVELLVATAISAVVIAGGVALLMSQERTFRTSAGQRALQDAARVALGELSANLRRAGLGVDPAYALDFGRTTSVLQAQAVPVPGASALNVGYQCNAPVTCRDRIGGPDEIVFYARDPSFGHTLRTLTSSTSISIAGPLNAALKKGQVLQIMCMGGEMYWAYVTVAGDVPASSGTGDVPVTLTAGNALDFPAQSPSLTEASAPTTCFSDGTAWVSKVDLFRYFVQYYSPDGTPNVPATSAGARPFLMLDQGLLNGADPILTVVAPDVEDLQFSYQFPRQPAATQVVGGPGGGQLTNGPGGIDLAAASSGFGIQQGDAARNTWHPSNIRAVRVSVVVRTQTFDDKIPDAIIPAAANRPDLAGPAGYRRLRVETTVQLPNLDARAPFFPFHSANNGVDRLNVGGS